VGLQRVGGQRELRVGGARAPAVERGGLDDHHRDARGRPRLGEHRGAARAARTHLHAREALVEQQLVHARRVGRVEVVPRPAVPERRVGEGVSPGEHAPRDHPHPARAERVCGGTQRAHRVAAHVVAHRRVAASHHHEIAGQGVAAHRAARRHRGAEPVVGTEQRERHGAGHDLLVRRGKEQLAGVARVQGVAALRVHHEHAPVGVAELGGVHERVHVGAERLARAGRGRDPGRGPRALRAPAGGRDEQEPRPDVLRRHGAPRSSLGRVPGARPRAPEVVGRVHVGEE
jgi:hypothetical protein